jgi:hypothetical protein
MGYESIYDSSMSIIDQIANTEALARTGHYFQHQFLGKWT